MNHYQIFIYTADGNRYTDDIAATNQTEAEATAREEAEEYDDVINFVAKLVKSPF